MLFSVNRDGMYVPPSSWLRTVWIYFECYNLHSVWSVCIQSWYAKAGTFPCVGNGQNVVVHIVTMLWSDNSWDDGPINLVHTNSQQLLTGFQRNFMETFRSWFFLVIAWSREISERSRGGSGGSVEPPRQLPSPVLNSIWKWNNFSLSETKLFHFHGSGDILFFPGRPSVRLSVRLSVCLSQIVSAL